MIFLACRITPVVLLYQRKDLTNMKVQKPVIRKPKAKEQYAAKIETSDFQISSLNIQSAILFSMNLSSRIYRSKTTIIQYNTKKKAERFRKIFNKILSEFSVDMSMIDFYKRMSYSTSNVNKQIGVNIHRALKGARSWNKLLSYDELYVRMGKNSEATDKATELLNEAKNLYNLPSKFLKYLSTHESFSSISGDAFFEPIAKDFWFFNGKNVGEFRKYVNKYIDSVSHEAKRGHSQTILENEAVEIQNKIIDEIGCKLTPDILFDWLKRTDPNSKDRLLDNCLLNIDEQHFDTFEELCLYLYSPNVMSYIRGRQCVDVRARAKGEVRKGIELTYERNLIERSNRKAEKIISKLPENITLAIKHAVETLDLRSKEYNEAREIKKQLKKALSTAQECGDDKKAAIIRSEYENASQVVSGLRGSVSNAKKALKNAESMRDKKAEALETLKKNVHDELKLIERIDSNNEVCSYDLVKLRKDLERKMHEQDEIPYSTWEFYTPILSIKLANYIVNKLETNLNKPKEQYINVMWSYDKNDEIIKFYVDYPSKSNIFKAFQKDNSLAQKLLDAMIQEMPVTKKKIVITSTKTNVSMETSLMNEV